MIADTKNTRLPFHVVKKFIIPDLRPFRALFFLFLFSVSARPATAQIFNVDSLIHLVEVHPQNDSAKIHMMHTISYLLSESDVNKSFAYYEKVSSLSDSLHFTYGKALASINLGNPARLARKFRIQHQCLYQSSRSGKRMQCTPPRSRVIK